MSWIKDLIDFLNPGSDPVDKVKKKKEPEPPAETTEQPEESPKRTRSTRRTTVVGRVVYNRKRHFFTIQDVKRVLRNILENDMGLRSDPIRYGEDLIEILNALREITASYTTLGVYDAVKQVFEDFLKVLNPKK